MLRHNVLCDILHLVFEKSNKFFTIIHVLGLFVNDRAIKNYVSTYNTNAICIFTTVKPAEFKSGAHFLKHPVVVRTYLPTAVQCTMVWLLTRFERN